MVIKQNLISLHATVLYLVEYELCPIPLLSCVMTFATFDCWKTSAKFCGQSRTGLAGVDSHTVEPNRSERLIYSLHKMLAQFQTIEKVESIHFNNISS